MGENLLVLSELRSRDDLANALRGRSTAGIEEMVRDLGLANVLEQIAVALSTTASPTGTLPSDAVVQWRVRGEETLPICFVIEDGVFRARPGEHPAPRVTIGLSVVDFLRLLADELNVVTAFLARRIQVEGDLLFARSIEKWFDR